MGPRAGADILKKGKTSDPAVASNPDLSVHSKANIPNPG